MGRARVDRPEKFGRYTTLLELGRGGMAELLLARRSSVGGFEKLVAIKRILPHLAEDASFRELFLNEGRIAARLAHPNVCAVHELDEADGELFLAMEYLEGVGWDVLVQAAPRGALGMRLAAGAIVQACEGLHYAHTLRDPATGQVTPVVHRDVSPQNLFVTVDGTCKVLDFGIAKTVGDGPRTRTGVLKGKLPYMAPEQIQGEPVDARTDVFALGVCLWEALTGERLYDRETDFLIWKAITEEPVPSINAKVVRYPEGLDGVIARALARRPADRFASAKELAAAIAGVVSPMTDTEIAGLVRSLCADRLAKRAAQIATVVSESRAESLAMRAVQDGGDEDPGATAFERPRAQDTAPSASDAAVTIPHQQPAPTATVSMALRGESLVMPRPPRPRWPIAVLVLLAAGAMIAVIAIATSGGGETSTPAVVIAPPVAPSLIDAPPVASVSLSAGGLSISGADGTTVEIAKPSSGGKPTVEIKLPSKRRAPPPAPLPPPQQPQPVQPPELGVPGTLSIDSQPYAHVFVDGHAAGDTPLFGAPIAAGKHALRVVLADGREKTLAIDVPPGGAVNEGTLHW